MYLEVCLVGLCDIIFSQGLAISKELEDEIGEGIVSGNLGMAYEILCSLDDAQEQYKKVN